MEFFLGALFAGFFLLVGFAMGQVSAYKPKKEQADG